MTPGDRQVAAPFLRGSLDGFSLAEVFAVLALSRQFYGLRFSDAEREVGTIANKAGRVIAAEDFRSHRVGADALRALVDDPGTAFAVDVLPPGAPERGEVAAIGGLAECLPAPDDGIADVEAVEEAAEPAAFAPLVPAPLLPVAERADIPEPPPPEPPPLEPPPPEPPSLAPLAPEPGGDVGDAPPLDPGDALLDGNFSDASFEEVLEVVQLSEQPVVIAFSRDGAPVGTLTLRSELVLAAETGALRGIEAFRRLHADHGDSFELRRAPAEDAGEALGSVSVLLADLRQPAAGAAPDLPREGPLPLMRGRLSDFPLERLIGSLGLSRQPIELEFRRDGAVLHRVRVKSGFVVGADGDSGNGGAAAIAAIAADPGDEFLVYRSAAPFEGPPLARLAALVPEPGEEPAPAPEPTGPDAGAAAAAPSPSKPSTPLADLLARLDRDQRPEIEGGRAAPDAGAPGRRVRTLLWAILGVQIASLALILAGLALALA